MPRATAPRPRAPCRDSLLSLGLADIVYTLTGRRVRRRLLGWLRANAWQHLRLMTAQGNRTPALLSVVAPVYNEVTLIEDFVRRTCAAVAEYTFELILVDDGSPDGTSEVLD